MICVNGVVTKCDFTENGLRCQIGISIMKDTEVTICDLRAQGFEVPIWNFKGGEPGDNCEVTNCDFTGRMLYGKYEGKG